MRGPMTGAAKQSITTNKRLDCFAPLAMTLRNNASGRRFLHAVPEHFAGPANQVYKVSIATFARRVGCPKRALFWIHINAKDSHRGRLAGALDQARRQPTCRCLHAPPPG